MYFHTDKQCKVMNKKLETDLNVCQECLIKKLWYISLPCFLILRLLREHYGGLVVAAVSDGRHPISMLSSLRAHPQAAVM